MIEQMREEPSVEKKTKPNRKNRRRMMNKWILTGLFTGMACGLQAAILITSDQAWDSNEVYGLSNSGMQTNWNTGGGFGAWSDAMWSSSADSETMDMQATTSSVQRTYTAGYTYSYRASGLASSAAHATKQIASLTANGNVVGTSRVTGVNHTGSYGVNDHSPIYSYYTVSEGDGLIGQTIGLRLSSEEAQTRYLADGSSSLRAVLTTHAKSGSEIPSWHAATGTLFETEFEMESDELVAVVNPVGMGVADGAHLIVTNTTDSFFRMNLTDIGSRNRFKLEAAGESFQASTSYRFSFSAQKSIESDVSQNEINIILGGTVTKTLSIGTLASNHTLTVNADEASLTGKGLSIEFEPAGAAVTNGVNQYRIFNLDVSAEPLSPWDGQLYQTLFETNDTGLVAADYILDMAFSGTGRFDQDAGSSCYVLGSADALSVASVDDAFRPGTTYEIAFKARCTDGSVSPELQVSVGSFTTNVVVGADFAHYVLSVDANTAGISGEHVSIGLASADSNEYQIQSLSLSGGGRTIERWMEDNNQRAAGGVPPDFLTRFEPENIATWEQTLETMDVWYIRSNSYNSHMKGNSAAMTRMAEVFNEYGIKVALDETAATWGHFYNDYETPDYQVSIDRLQDLQDHGFELCAVGLQSVLSKPIGNGTAYDMSWRILDIVEYIRQVKPHFPDLDYGVIDAMPAKGWEYKSHYSTLKNTLEAYGLTLGFMEQDFPIDFAIAGSRTYEEMVDAERFARFALGWKTGLYLTSARGGMNSDELWRADVLNGLDDFLTAGAAPETITLAAWYTYPSYSTPDEPDPDLNPNGATMAGTFLLVDEKLAEFEFIDSPQSMSLSVDSDQPLKLVADFSTPTHPVFQWTALTGREYNLYISTNLVEGFTLLEGGMVYPQSSWMKELSIPNSSAFFKLEVVNP
ncbi:hypothetical protein ACWPKO_10465 [Coraliomargarita sp. W4R53]